MLTHFSQGTDHDFANDFQTCLADHWGFPGHRRKITAAALAHGDAVVATARNAQSLIERFGAQPGLLAAQLDVTDEAQARDVAQMAVEYFGRIDVLVNNAGFGLLGAVEEASGDEIRRVYETNVFGLLNVTRGYCRTCVPPAVAM